MNFFPLYKIKKIYTIDISHVFGMLGDGLIVLCSILRKKHSTQIDVGLFYGNVMLQILASSNHFFIKCIWFPTVQEIKGFGEHFALVNVFKFCLLHMKQSLRYLQGKKAKVDPSQIFLYLFWEPKNYKRLIIIIVHTVNRLGTTDLI